MRVFNVVELTAGTTIKSTCRNLSGESMDGAWSTLIDRDGSLVSSVSAVSSGGGMYFAMLSIPNTTAWYVNKWYLSAAPNTYAAHQYLKAVVPGV
jgi:hypothetical protein